MCIDYFIGLIAKKTSITFGGDLNDIINTSYKKYMYIYFNKMKK